MVTDFLGIIPARFASTRFPGKPLAQLGNKPMIQWVYDSAASIFRHVVVATDDERIFDRVKSFGGNVVMTSPDHGSGTERCAEALRLYQDQNGMQFTYAINIQGDEPLLNPEQLERIVDCTRGEGVQIATLIRPLRDLEEVDNPNVVKVVVDQHKNALYFSRASIPYIRDASAKRERTQIPFYAHIGLYAFRASVLLQIVELSPTPLEKAESLEQLRWLQHGIPIRTEVTTHASPGVDTPEDLEKVRSMILG